MEAVSNAWDSVDWDTLQGKIEMEINALGERQDDSEDRRKRLVEESNSYRERTDKEARKVAVPLIKAFQSEFDGLIARSQSAESALIDICSQITNLPDPKSLLKGAEAWKNDAEKTKRAVEERETLKKQLQDANNQLADLRNHDAELRKLKEQAVRTEAEHQHLIDESVDEVEKRLQNEFAIRIDEMNLKQEKMRMENEILEKKLNDTESRNKDFQRKLDAAKMANNQKESLESEQLSIAVKDLSDANHRIILLEEKLSQMTSELAKINETKARGGIDDFGGLAEKLVEKEETIGRLVEQIKNIENGHKNEMEKLKSQSVTFEKEMTASRKMVEELKSQLESKSDYEAIKNELRLLREIEFGAPSSESPESLGESVETLDRLLAEKNRRLQNENASLRVLNEGYKDEKQLSNGNTKNIKKEVIEDVDIVDNTEYSSIDLLALLNQIKNETPTTKQIRTPTHTITTTALPPKQRSFDFCDSPPTEEDDAAMKLTSSIIAVAQDVSPMEQKTVEKMQQQIQSNVRKLGSRALNTMEIARQCKRLMVAYNIGQRLFAKHVMNQVVKSQGSLSELLSKPRHWSKLTDKGREAFRRIYAWISDDVAIDLLCSLSPRRVWPSEQKIEHPDPESLWESNCANLPPYEETKENPFKPSSAREDQYRLAGTSNTSRNNNSCSSTMPMRSSRWRHDDISKEKIMSIFQAEMAKIKEQESNVERIVVPRNGTGSMPNNGEKTPEKTTKMTSVERIMKQRMSNGMQPITQQQFDTYSQIDTEQLVKQVKEFLTLHTISQRQFGENVLGLSQGSVSDLLARPKTWNQLTQKGREPFIRMQLFLEEVNGGGVEIRIMDEDSDLAKTLATLLKNVPMNNENGCVEGRKEDNFEMMQSGSSLENIVKFINTSSSDDIVDTFEVVRGIKQKLEDNGISQKIFGEHFLHCSPGTCDDMLNHTKNFFEVPTIEKELFRKMRQFLANPGESLQELIHKEATREDILDNLFNATNNKTSLKRKASADSQDDETEPKRQIQRTVITDFQKDTLRFVFANEQHPNIDVCTLLATKLDMSVRTVQNWFHNHRTRTRAREREGKIYSDAMPTGNEVQKCANWKVELDNRLAAHSVISETTSKSFSDLIEPTDVVNSLVNNIKTATTNRVINSSSSSSNTNNNNHHHHSNLADILLSPSTNQISAVKKSTSGTLDKLVEKMRQIAEEKREIEPKTSSH